MPPLHTIHTYAKINLILQVAPPLPDGMHPICSWMHSINLCDEITIEPTQKNQSEFDIRWSDGNPVQWNTQSDLMTRAHALIESEINRPLPIKLTAKKTIPAGAGLGGGSSNAAGVLMGLNDLFKLALDEPTLQRLASRIGSDIPYFIDLESHHAGTAPKPAIVTSTGTHIKRTPRLSHPLILLLPDFGCPTAEVYRSFDTLAQHSPLQPSRVESIASSPHLDPSQLINELSNDLRSPAMLAQPLLAESFRHLKELGLHAQLSGSGSTIYLLESQLTDHPDAKTLLETLRASFRVECTTLI